MKHRKKNEEERLEQAFRRLGTREPCCTVCGVENPFCLERHHLAGRQHHGDTAIVCRNCHRTLSNLQHDHISPPSTECQTVTISRYLLGLSDFLAETSITLRGFGRALMKSQDGKDSK